MYRNIVVMGSTGSIGTQTLEVARKLDIKVKALTAYSSIELLEKQIREFRPEYAAVFLPDKARQLKDSIRDTDTKVLAGIDGMNEISSLDGYDLFVSSIVGMAGIEPTLTAINSKKDIAFANKETLVAGGEVVMNAVKENGVKMLPVDSEHSAVFQCLEAAPKDRSLKKIILTASGGPFFGKTKEELKGVTVQQALNHPNWSMGAKITIDSATMMNKGLEVIEAAWLFDMDPKDIDVIVHRESIIHSMIEFSDNAVLAQLGMPDMRIPIQYAITYPDRFESLTDEIDFAKISEFTFFKPDYDTFKCLRVCKDAIDKGGLYPCYANAANEVANKLFREGKITFLEIGDLVEMTVNHFAMKNAKCLKDVLDADKEAREYVRNTVKI